MNIIPVCINSSFAGYGRVNNSGQVETGGFLNSSIRLIFPVIYIIIFLFAECTLSPRYTRSPQKRSIGLSKHGKSTGSLYGESDDGSYQSIGLASYYASKFEGRKTASGEIFSNSLLTGAHPSFPFGTNVRVTCLANSRSVIVRINDRGPFSSKKRIIDISQSAARELGIIKKGVAKVRIEIVD